MPPARRPRTRPGFTLIELAIVLAAVSLLAALLQPMLAGIRHRQQLQDAVQALQADIGLAREQAGRLARPVHLSFQPGLRWCYALATRADLDCSQPADTDGLIKRVQADPQATVRLAEASPMALDGSNGARIGAQGQALFSTPEGRQVRVRLGRLGRASLCAPGTGAAELPPCPAEPA